MRVAITQLPARINQSSHQANLPINPHVPLTCQARMLHLPHIFRYSKEAPWGCLIGMSVFLLKNKSMYELVYCVYTTVI